MATIMWFSECQPTVKSRVFGAECVVIEDGIESCCQLHCKLIIMGVTLSGPTFLYGDNMYVVHKTQQPESVFKKSNSMCYHVVRKSAAMGESIVGHVPSVDNPDDICTKFVMGGQKRNNFICLLLHDLCD
jgi:hypothetical protein